jgi:hypothetical protein
MVNLPLVILITQRPIILTSLEIFTCQHHPFVRSYMYENMTIIGSLRICFFIFIESKTN